MKYKLFAVNNTKKSDVRGFWLDKKHIYADKIHISEYKTGHSLQRGINSLFNLNEKSVFYTSRGKAYLQNSNGKIDILEHRRIYRRNKLSHTEVKNIINKYNGATIYKKENGYIIEVYYNIS